MPHGQRLAMLVKWHRWLKSGGRLHIETPDLMGSARTLTSGAPWSTKMGVVRHLAGDQAAAWAYHVDGGCVRRLKGLRNWRRRREMKRV